MKLRKFRVFGMRTAGMELLWASLAFNAMIWIRKILATYVARHPPLPSSEQRAVQPSRSGVLDRSSALASVNDALAAQPRTPRSKKNISRSRRKFDVGRDRRYDHCSNSAPVERVRLDGSSILWTRSDRSGKIRPPDLTTLNYHSSLERDRSWALANRGSTELDSRP